MKIDVEARLAIINELNKKDKKDLTADEKKLIEKEKQRVYRLNKRHTDIEFNERCKGYNKKYYHSDKGQNYHDEYYKNKVDGGYLNVLNERNRVKRQEYKKLVEENQEMKKIIENIGK